jgi:hypothetical protein
MTRKKPRTSTTRRLHRSLGAGAAVFVIFMVLSGLAINHSNGLDLNQRHVSQPLLLDWYGLEGPDQIRSFVTGINWVSFAGSQLYFNDKAVTDITGGVGIVTTPDMLVVAGREELLLLDFKGRLIEQIPWGLQGEGPIESIGLLADGRVIIRTPLQLWIADTQLLSWQPVEGKVRTPAWSFPGPAPVALQQAITRHYRGHGLSLERLILDFHSGRIFGTIGVFIYDLLALAVGFLAISGLVFWLRSRRNGNGNK